ncbi:MAG: YfiR/HmsC family protein [Cytophagales bacterium]
MNRTFQIYALTVILLFSTLISANVKAQTVTPSILRAGMAYKISQNIEWSNESAFTSFTYGVLTEDEEVFNAFNKNLTKATWKNKPIKVKRLNSISEIKDVNVVYIGTNYTPYLKEILEKTNTQSILLMSEKAVDKKSVMINFYNDNNQLKFEINKANIINGGMKIGPQLVLLGGTEIDVAQLYKDTQQNLDKEKDKVKQQQHDLDIMKVEIDIKKQEIEKQHVEIEKQKAELEKQKVEIENQKKTLVVLNENVVKQQKTLDEKLAILAEQVKKIADQELSIKNQETEMKEKAAKLDLVTVEIENQQKRIKEQKLILLKQNATIQLQQNLIYVFGVFALLLVALGFFIYRSYQLQKKFNKTLASKNEIIEKGAQLLELEKEHTMNSIHYAKTIQNAVLPSPEEMNKHIRSFVVFQPKDIVSGDFFWFHHVAELQDNTEKIIVAAMDCTGHGVPGAFMSMIGNSLLNELVKEKQMTSPSEILHHLDKNVRHALKQGESDNNDGMDACMCLIERKKGDSSVKLTFCGAKRPLYYMLPDTNKLEMLKGDRKSIGGAIKKVREVNFENQTMNLPKDTKLFLTTDGFVDQNNLNRDKFGRKNFEQLIVEAAGKSLGDQQSILENALIKHKGEVAQRDDITLVGIQI